VIESALLEVRLFPWRPRPRVMKASTLREAVDLDQLGGVDDVAGLVLVLVLALWLAILLAAPATSDASRRATCSGRCAGCARSMANVASSCGGPGPDLPRVGRPDLAPHVGLGAAVFGRAIGRVRSRSAALTGSCRTRAVVIRGARRPFEKVLLIGDPAVINAGREWARGIYAAGSCRPSSRPKPSNRTTPAHAFA
jgi:hypothetical protein